VNSTLDSSDHTRSVEQNSLQITHLCKVVQALQREVVILRKEQLTEVSCVHVSEHSCDPQAVPGPLVRPCEYIHEGVLVPLL
jgi:hypothetical protein